MVEFLKKIGVLLIGFFLIGNLMSFGSLWVLREGSFYKPSFLATSIKRNNFDYIVLGTSTGLTTLNTRHIDALTHKKGINLSVDDTSISSQYLMLQHFVAQGKTTKICVLAPSMVSYDTQDLNVNANDYRFLPYINRDYVSNYYKSFSSTESVLLSGSRYVPLLGVSYYNAELFFPSLLSLIKPERRNRFDAQGNYTYPNQNMDSKLIKNRKEIHLKFKNEALKKIKALCDSQGIQLICYLSPMQSRAVTAFPSTYTVINHTAVLNDVRYFYDDIHVNTSGRQIISERFAGDLRPFFN